MADARRRLPSVDVLLRSEPGRRASSRFGRAVVREALRAVLAAARPAAARGEDTPDPAVLTARAVGLAARMSLGLAPVINATGVVLHTNLGRAPLPAEAVRAVARRAAGYSDLEVDRTTGDRGRRTVRAEFILRGITGAEAALVVNNNAAALLLALSALARRKEVPVSRGELIEVGGGFRLPDIMAASGARMVEVGTTNRTRLQDFREAVSPRTAMLLKVHPSNYRVVGFTRTPAASSLAGLAHGAGLPLLHDIGSGLLERVRGVPDDEPSAGEALADGADLVCFSGDKLLGGPQAGVILGRADLVARLRTHPIARAVRVDKMTVAALEAVLGLYARGRRDAIPAWRALQTAPAEVRRRAAAMAEALPGATVSRAESVAGGGSLPGWSIPSWVVRVPSPEPEPLAARLRAGRPSVFARVQGDAVLLDLRTVDPSDDERLARAVRYARSQETGP